MIFLFAGEISGDQIGAELVKELQKQEPRERLFGVGGPKMRALGFECILEMEDFLVMGFVDVFLALPKLIRQFYAVKRTILELKAQKVVLIDYPGFNLRLARALRKGGYQGKICHYICPSVWAWGKKRIPLMANTLDLLLSILPFEKEMFAKTKLNVRFVGHPLVRHIERFTPTPLPELEKKRVLGLFPGSRSKEIERNLKLQLITARRLKTLVPDLEVALSVANPKFCSRIQHLCAEAGIAPHLIPQENTYDLMRSCHLALATSGTITLELALHSVPTVVTYGISKLDLIIAKQILRIDLPYYCLVNIIANDSLFPELIGPRLTLDALFEKSAALLVDETARTACIAGCVRVRALLGKQEASSEAASAILAL